MGKIVIDAGHGGRDVGAVGRISTEANNVLKVALELSTILKRSGHTVILTRSTNTFISLYQRSVKSNLVKPDIFVSLHNNSASSSSANGFETFILHNKVSSNTKRLQRVVHRKIANNIPLRDRGMKTMNLAVLRETHAPALLIEYGFINNKNEEKYLVENYKLLAQLTADGINEYFGIKTNSIPKPPQKPAPAPKPTENTNKKEEEKMKKLITNLEKRVSDLEGAMLHDTQKRDMKKLLTRAYNEGIFFEDHSKNVDKMTQSEAVDLMLSYVARKDS